MIINNYSICFIDCSFLLTRNLWMGTKDVPIAELSPAPVIKLIIQTLRKCQRDYEIRPEKFIMIADKWDSTIGGYYGGFLTKEITKKLGLGGYKSSRKWVNKQVLDEMKANPETTKEDLEKAERDYAVNQIKFECKRIIKEEFPKIGIPYFEWSGYEFDQITTLAAFERYGKTDLPDVILTKDTDLQYSLTPSCRFFSLPTRGSEPRIISYDEKYYEIPEVLRNSGMSLYMYNAYQNALGKSHNDMSRTLKKNWDPTDAILHIAQGDYSCIEPDRIELFQAQLKSYDLSIFPRVEEVKKEISKFNTVGHMPKIEDFHQFCATNNVSGITDKYFNDFTSLFDSKLFTEHD